MRGNRGLKSTVTERTQQTATYKNMSKIRNDLADFHKTDIRLKAANKYNPNKFRKTFTNLILKKQAALTLTKQTHNRCFWGTLKTDKNATETKGNKYVKPVSPVTAEMHNHNIKTKIQSTFFAFPAEINLMLTLQHFCIHRSYLYALYELSNWKMFLCLLVFHLFTTFSFFL